MAPEDIVRKTLDATTQMVSTVEAEKIDVPERHLKSRLPFLREKGIDKEVHSNKFYPIVKLNQGHTCSQLFLEKRTD